jgi:hypothetical protein
MISESVAACRAVQRHPSDPILKSSDRPRTTGPPEPSHLGTTTTCNPALHACYGHHPHHPPVHPPDRSPTPTASPRCRSPAAAPVAPIQWVKQAAPQPAGAHAVVRTTCAVRAVPGRPRAARASNATPHTTTTTTTCQDREGDTRARDPTQQLGIPRAGPRRSGRTHERRRAADRTGVSPLQISAPARPAAARSPRARTSRAPRARAPAPPLDTTNASGTRAFGRFGARDCTVKLSGR